MGTINRPMNRSLGMLNASPGLKNATSESDGMKTRNALARLGACQVPVVVSLRLTRSSRLFFAGAGLSQRLFAVFAAFAAVFAAVPGGCSQRLT